MPTEDEPEDAPTPATPASGGDAKKIYTVNSTPQKGPKTPAQHQRKLSENKAATTGQKKKDRPEPTLLGDFLLGRPSPNRPKNVIDFTSVGIPGLGKRKSLEDVKRGIRLGMSEDNMRRVKQPGKVQVRVMQWQRENAKAANGEPVGKKDYIVVEVEETEEEGVRMRGGKRPGRRKDLNDDDNEDGGVRIEVIETPTKPKPKETPESKSKLRPVTPKKRVISDEHWMKGRKKTPPKKTPPKKGNPIPKNFLQATATNPPVESKIKDWINRTEYVPPREIPRNTPKSAAKTTPKESPKTEETFERNKSKKPSLQKPEDDGIRIKPAKDRPYDDGIRVTASKASTNDDGIRVTPLKKPAYDDGIRVTGSNLTSTDDGIRVAPSKVSSYDDGIRVTPLKVSSNDDGIRVTPSQPSSSGNPKRKPSNNKPPPNNSQTTPSKPTPKNDGIRVTPLDNKPEGRARTQSPRRNEKDGGVPIKEPRERSTPRTRAVPNQKPNPTKPAKKEEEVTTPKSKTEKHLKLAADVETSSRRSSHAKSANDEADTASHVTPTPSGNKRGKRKSDTSQNSLDDIPFGNSAFSVLDLPLGAEAGTMKPKRPPQPKRNPSFAVAVPKVLKKVYQEGLKIVHDTAAEPPRGGPNQPPSIDSWLNATTDPFMDQHEDPAHVASTLDIPPIKPLRRKSYREDDQSEIELTAGHDKERKGHRKSVEIEERDEQVTPKAKHRNTLPTMQNSPLVTPPGLKRTPATRSTPKATRKIPLKEAIFDAFKGESGMKGKKDDAPSPFDFIGLREREIDLTPPAPRSVSEMEPVRKETPLSRPRTLSQTKTADHDEAKPLPLFPRRQGPSTGHHRLSTIASVETFSTSGTGVSLTETSLTGSALTGTSLTESSLTGSSLTETTVTGSNLTSTTLTQDTAVSGATRSSLSRRSKGSKGSKKSPPGLQRRLTKHSDLISVLSLPDTVQRGKKPGSIRSVRSLKRTLTKLENETVDTFMDELSQDELKYMRELNTLVDGVIPVLLTCVLSKTKSAVAAGLFNPQSGVAVDSSFTEPIIDMGKALERLKTLHKRIPLEESDAFLSWARSSLSTYNDYLTAWRAGFQDVVINLAPASAASTVSTTDPEEMARNEDGDVVRDDGERVDVAFLLKRPVIRIKKLAKIAKALDKIKQTRDSQEVNTKYAELDARRIRRVQEETARLQDSRANNMDTTRVRDVRTLFQMEGAIDSSYQVGALDMFSFEMHHSSGQQIACKVEMILRDKALDITDGDLLICEFDGAHTFLLFPPISRNLVSARLGTSGRQLVVMIRGTVDDEDWSELFTVEAEDHEAARDWLKMLGSTPVPPQIERRSMRLDPGLASVVEDPQADTKSIVGALRHAPSTSIPLGVRRRPTVEEKLERERTSGKGLTRETSKIEVEEPRSKEQKQSPPTTPTSQNRRVSSHRHQIMTDLADQLYGEEIIEKTHELCILDVVELEDILVKTENTPPHGLKRLAQKYRLKKAKPDMESMMVGGLDPYPDEKVVEEEEVLQVDEGNVDPDTNTEPIMTEKPPIPAQKDSTPLKESMRPEIDEEKKQLKLLPRDDGAPPPPVHRLPTTPRLKAPVIETPAPRVRRRTSSPLKHEYQPSDDASSTSSAEEEEYSESESESSESSGSSGTYSDSSEDEGLPEVEDMPTAIPEHQNTVPRKVSPSGSIYSQLNTSLAPSNSASQGPYRSVPVEKSESGAKKALAMISTWSNKHGKWEDLWEEPCSIVISPGVIRAFELTHGHSSPSRNSQSSGSSDASHEGEEDTTQPLVQQVLTPVISLRRSNAIDIEITSPATMESILKKRVSPQGHIRYRAFNEKDCMLLYAAIHHARLNNPIYKKLEMERTINAYGGHAYEDAVKSNRRRSWLGRKHSYRASNRASSEMESEKSSGTSSSAFSALKRLSAGGIFNIRSSSGDQSQYSSDRSSSNPSTPGMSPSLAGTSNYSAGGGMIKDLGNENLMVRLYCQETGGKDWHQFGYTRLSVTTPPMGMRQASSLNHGTEKRLLVTKDMKTKNDDHMEEEIQTVTVLDVVLGANCFSKMGTTGIVCNVWEDIVGDDGVVGRVRREGGVSGRTRKWLLHAGSGAEREWIFGLVGVGR